MSNVPLLHLYQVPNDRCCICKRPTEVSAAQKPETEFSFHADCWRAELARAVQAAGYQDMSMVPLDPATGKAAFEIGIIQE